MKYEVGKWYGWTGGDCPVHPETVVNALVAKKYNDVHFKSRSIAGDFDWSKRVFDGEIIAFRIIKEYKEPRELKKKRWCLTCYDENGKIIYEREVIE